MCGEVKPAEEFYFVDAMHKYRRHVCGDCDALRKRPYRRLSLDQVGRDRAHILEYDLKAPMPWPREINPPRCGQGMYRCESCGPDLIELCQARVAAVLPVACEFMDGFDMLRLEVMA
jgi:hypothetical protein